MDCATCQNEVVGIELDFTSVTRLKTRSDTGCCMKRKLRWGQRTKQDQNSQLPWADGNTEENI